MTLKGFKSFASSTTLRLEPGITCVVGPNGSGKSNVVDALTWVMGEQGAKSLRGGKMEDVIFAGTSGRAPLGRAEVSLTIDNTDGALPIDYTEVTISRILFRNGQSEYQINGEASRLLDIQELLSDSGIGREMHVIVGQGQLDAILMATPEERRGFIEEAAGVLKHRKRKEKALRKLDSMQANMARVQDLTVELRRQLRPLGKQAEVAKKAATIQADLRDAKLRLLADDFISMSRTLDAEVADETALRQKRAEVERELETIRSREEALEAQSAVETPLLVQAQETYYQLNSLREKFRGTQSLAQERSRFLNEEAEEARSAGRDPEALEKEARVLRNEENALRNNMNDSRAALAAATSALANAEQALKMDEDKIAAAMRAIADAREGTARQEGHIKSLKARLEAIAEEIARLTKARDDAQHRADSASREYASFELEIASADSGELGLDSVFESAKSALDASKARLNALIDSERAADRERNAVESKLEAMKLTSQNRDGASALMRDSRGVHILGSIASLIEIDNGWESAAAAALGSLADAIVVQDLSSAVTALTTLRNQNLGQANVLVYEAGTIGNSNIPSGLDALSSHIRSHSIGELISSLLASTVVAENARDAEAILRSHPSVNVVTRDGDLITKSSARGGSKSSSSLIEIKALIESLETKLIEITHTCDRLKFEIATATTEVADCQSSFDVALSKLNESDAHIASITEQLAVSGQNMKSALAEVERLNASIQEASSAKRRDEGELVIAQNQLHQQGAVAEPDHTFTENLRNAVSLARTSEVEARLAVRTIEERVDSVAARAKALEDSARNEREASERAILRRGARARAAVISQDIAEAAYEVLIHIERSIAKAATERARLEESRTTRDGETLAVRTRGRELTAELEQLTSSVHKDEIARAEQRMRIETLENKTMEEFGIDTQVLVSEYGPDKDVPTFFENEAGEIVTTELIPYRRDQQEKRLASAERSLALLGKINPLALEEFSSLEERLKFLAEQLEDLKNTKKDLLDIIKEVDDRVQSIFMEAFESTATHFEDIFSRLFPGGDGRLILTDPDNPLTSGVDVEARPPGKRIKRLSLLSGGEKSLTAVAMLVAIFKARPSPFYVLDEVEAALDDINLGRLLVILEELRASSQLIIITHQKRTMEIADALYGVTMRGDGVTEVISQRLRESDAS
ncbi:MAG: chromosome segregation protein SMC [Actinobacteria bacterium]|jgi:chromosome segregation protein|nr:chromosome segregation protein SMC [Actinomycetota bacterium]NCW42856.1 chromosome segregation protein SMC [Actinomycetota bacterium]NCW92224.1 chromosome segregation protein SMC [Actinomycetota bacterium]NCX15942.1 chromosome segregation protein SMC [Actinomycetota bacterium]NCX38728.1 chromosome segregation protein SMC [Actinomycetota bacterium]